jgi:hypothetical protein
MQNSKGSGDFIAKVDTGPADIGRSDSAVVIAAVARGAKVKVVGMCQRSPKESHPGSAHTEPVWRRDPSVCIEVGSGRPSQLLART